MSFPCLSRPTQPSSRRSDLISSRLHCSLLQSRWSACCPSNVPSSSLFLNICICSFLGEKARSWEALGEARPGQSSLSAGALRYRAWAKSRTRLSDFTFTFHFHALEKEMATHSSVLAWRIPGTGELVGCRLWGCTESDTTEAALQQLSSSY